MPTSLLIPSPWPEAEIGERGPRAVRLTADTRFRLNLLRIASILIVAIGIWVVRSQSNDLERLIKEGRTAEAVVDELEVGRSDDHVTYTVGYLYRVNRLPYTGRKVVSQAEFESLHKGSHVLVTYLPSAPDEQRYGQVSESEVTRMQQMGGFLVFLIAAFPAGLALEMRMRSRKQAAILAHWRAIPAQVVEVTRQEGSVSAISYRIPQPDGGTLDQERQWPPHGFSTPVGGYFPVLVSPNGSVSKPLWDLPTVEIDPSSRSLLS